MTEKTLPAKSLGLFKLGASNPTAKCACSRSLITLFSPPLNSTLLTMFFFFDDFIFFKDSANLHKSLCFKFPAAHTTIFSEK